MNSAPLFVIAPFLAAQGVFPFLEWVGVALLFLVLIGATLIFLTATDGWLSILQVADNSWSGLAPGQRDRDPLGGDDQAQAPRPAEPLMDAVRLEVDEERQGDHIEIIAPIPTSDPHGHGAPRRDLGPVVEPRLPFEAGRERRDARCKMDLAATSDGLELTLELPGVDEKDLEIQLADDVLTIGGEIRFEPDWEQKNYRVVERDYGAFSRSIALPEGVPADRITAVLSRGLLKVVIPNPTKSPPKKIHVQAPPVYLAATADGLELTVEAPGLEAEDIQVAVTNGLLTVRTGRPIEFAALNNDKPAVEHSGSAFSRAIELPDGVNADHISAALSKGLLKVTIPTSIGFEPKRIEVLAAV